MLILKAHELRSRIEKTGLTIPEFAQQYGFQADTLRKYCRGVLNAKRNKILQLANALHCLPDDIAMIVIKTNPQKRAYKEKFLEEINYYSIYLKEKECQTILEIVKTFAEPRIQSESQAIQEITDSEKDR